MSDSLLAVDLGIRTGFARFGRDGRLTSYRSQNFGSRARLKRAIGSELRLPSPVGVLALEGGGDLADPWIAESRRLGIDVLQCSAHDWREVLLLPREQRSGLEAKRHAEALARRIITWSGAQRPTSLTHDVAEAICVGFWAVTFLGWIDHDEATAVTRRM